MTDSPASVAEQRIEGKAEAPYPMMPQRWRVAISLAILEFSHALTSPVAFRFHHLTALFSH
ncbi:hypothetical protein DFR58_111141 [Anaerobacterium chartisolvens]|uniref:Uncharacterized protein n=1 Tax=Anaerobacterium chartisolvens TaxID=1297424 RepID=A0A369B4C1_9FIRM|nr:hypothetical protein [Anaerobacterium chartisolvens]RCX16392.1 hypothetical protein DFR58_111141 [Anaerobacterium chartisolvens]